MEKRKNKRVKKKLIFSFVEEGFENIGITADISRQGMSILSPISLPENKEVQLHVAIFNEIYEIKGKVMWSRTPYGNDEKTMKGAGIQITQAPAEYQNYVDLFYQQSHFRDMS